MLSAISNINGSAYVSAADRPQFASTRSETATAALAALSPVQPLPSVSDSFEDPSDTSSFLYDERGLPAGAAQGGLGNAPARLGMESTQLTALLSSLMISSGAVPKETAPAAPARSVPTGAAVQEPLASKLYRQF